MNTFTHPSVPTDIRDDYRIVDELVRAKVIRSISQERLEALRNLRALRDQLETERKHLDTQIQSAEGKLIAALERGHKPEPGARSVKVAKVLGRISRFWKDACLYYASQLKVAPDEATQKAEAYGNGRPTKTELVIE